MNPKLCQIIAVEKEIKNRVQKTVTKLHRLSDASQVFNGMSKTYTPKDEDGERYPDEMQRVQMKAYDVLDAVSKLLSELWDIEATKDFGNAVAHADIVLEDGSVVMEKVPTPYLLFLEKQLNDVKTFVDKLPTLDPSHDWRKGEQGGLWRTEPVDTMKTKKVQKPLVLYPATEQHPAQTQLITEDVTVGSWTTVKLSGAIPSEDKAEILRRVVVLQKAVKSAREEANSTVVERKKVSAGLLRYLFGEI